MALKKSEKRLLIILGLALVAFMVDRLVLGKSDDKTLAQSEQPVRTVAPMPSAMAAGSTVQIASLAGKKQFETWSRDPFNDSPAAYTTGVRKRAGGSGKSGKPKKQPELKGLFWKAGDAYVMVNDDILKEGEEKEGLKIERVEGKAVFCRKGNRSFTLYWSESLLSLIHI